MNGDAVICRISIFVIALNEADRIGRTLESVCGLSDDIVVVDSGSTDDTRKIAESYGARVIHKDWQGYGLQKCFAEDECRHEWVLNLDADEVVTAELKCEINGLLKSGKMQADAYSVRIIDVIPGDSKPRPLAYAHNYVRLYRKGFGRFSSSTVHDLVCLKSRAIQAQLNGAIHHFSIRGLGEQMSKFNRYTDAQVADLAVRGVVIPVWRLFLEFPFAFLKAFVLRRHFMRGTYGFLTAMNYAIFRHLRIAKHYELRRGEAIRRKALSK